MSTKTPKEILHRVLLVSLIHGWSIALFAGLCALISLIYGDVTGLIVSLFVTVGGVMEIRGRKRLTQHDADGGIDLLIRAQLVVLGVIWAYAISRLVSFDPDTMLGQMTPEMRSAVDQAGLSTHELVHYVRLFSYALYGTIMFVTLPYLGGLTFYYRNRRAAVRQALTAVPAVPIVPPPVPSRPKVGDDVMDA